MEKYKDLIEFAERIRAKGVSEQQYIADGIFGLCADLMTAQAERDSSIGFFRDSSQVQNDSEKSRSQNDLERESEPDKVSENSGGPLDSYEAERETEREVDNPSVISDDTSLYTREASNDGAVAPLFPKGDFPEKGYIVEDKGGIRWEVAEVSYVCKRITPEEESAFRIPGIRMNFSAAEIGTAVKVIGK